LTRALCLCADSSGMRITLKNSCIVALLAVVVVLAIATAGAPKPKLKYVVIVTRHGVRSPTWDEARLNQYSAESWPEWSVAPGNLTPHGRALMKLMGDYYRDWLTGDRLLSGKGCESAAHIYIWADTAERTLETGRALAESLAPGCSLPIHSQRDGNSDPLFEGVGTPDPQVLTDAIRARLGSTPEELVEAHRGAFDALNSILGERRDSPKIFVDPTPATKVSAKGREIDLDGPLSLGSTLSENLLLEYADDLQGTNLGWGRLTKENLLQVLELHAAYADLTRRTPYLAQARGSNLLMHVLLSIEQAATQRPVSGAIGNPGDTLLILAGHDTNISNISGILNLSWKLPGYQPDDTPPGGALIFSLWQEPASLRLFVKTQYLAQSFDQMRNAIPLSLSSPPAAQEIMIPGCKSEAKQHTTACSWQSFQAILQHATLPAFTIIASNSPKTP
jgi:4-phytase/acid phosphatase